ncbi:DNA cytosine methyltransferase [Pelagimonas varians]|uniref:Cytosine-specific methyltransferase n=1 Tax=Pelagimonas varians TaxID=696760 RepID=A0A238KEX0_9RHOB|nr:DNA cytosine methyltransferase [Pelagimonas varians]PYG29953.1 DNA (cytosine-5)-methyltransferase 1 [Pelagimonas varians]SMX40662.1 Modification methylase HpaII [Pelagimonas varians]
MPGKLTYVDLFAGCGGLSLGLEQAGFALELAVEKSDMAAETFFHNFIEPISDQKEWKSFSAPSTPVEEQAKKGVVVKQLSDVLDCKPLLQDLKSREIDLVAGGPPCQGFSLAGRRNPEDIRNKLPWEFLEFVEAVSPKAVIIENVSGMSQDFKKHNQESPFDQLRQALIQTGVGYQVQPVHLNAMHFGAPQHRPRVMLLGLRQDVADATGFKFSDKTWRSEFAKLGSVEFSQKPEIAPILTHFGDDILTVADAIADLNDSGYRRVSNLSEFAKEMREGADWEPAGDAASKRRNKGLPNHTLRKHAEHIKDRFRLYQFFRDQGVHNKTIAIPKNEDLTTGGKRQLLHEALKDAKYPAKAPDGKILAHSVEELIELVLSLGTKKHSQRPLSWTSPSPTVVSLPDDYVHPDIPRTMTVREMARFQSFPDNFEFRAKETTGSLRRRVEVPQYTQVGNAVPPKMARAVGLSIRSALELAAITEGRRAS